MLYFIQGTQTGNVKIGHTTDRFIKRFAEAATLSSDPTICIGTTDGDSEAQVNLHRRFAHLRSHGEWFRPSNELLEFISNLPISIYTGKTYEQVLKASHPKRKIEDEQRMFEWLAYDMGYVAFKQGKALRDAVGLGDKGTPGYTRTLSMWKWGFEQASQGIPNRNKTLLEYPEPK